MRHTTTKAHPGALTTNHGGTHRLPGGFCNRCALALAGCDSACVGIAMCDRTYATCGTRAADWRRPFIDALTAGVACQGGFLGKLRHENPLRPRETKTPCHRPCLALPLSERTRRDDCDPLRHCPGLLWAACRALGRSATLLNRQR